MVAATSSYLTYHLPVDPLYRHNKRAAVTAAKILRFTARPPQKHAGSFFPTPSPEARHPTLGEGYKRAVSEPGRRTEAASAVLSWSRSRTAFDISITRFGIEATSNSMPPSSPAAATRFDVPFPRPLWKSGGDGKRGGADVEVQLISRGVKREGVRLVGGSKGTEQRKRHRRRGERERQGERQRGREWENTGWFGAHRGCRRDCGDRSRRICPYLLGALNSRDASQRRAANRERGWGRGGEIRSNRLTFRCATIQVSIKCNAVNRRCAPRVDRIAAAPVDFKNVISAATETSLFEDEKGFVTRPTRPAHRECRSRSRPLVRANVYNCRRSR